MMDVTVSDPVYLPDGRIDCIVDFGSGPMPYTASEDDKSPWGADIHAAALQLDPAPYVAPVHDPAADLATERARMRMTRYQTLAIFYTENLSDAVSAYMAGQPYLTQLAWAETTSFDRSNHIMLDVATALGLTDTQLDDLFRAGMLLTL